MNPLDGPGCSAQCLYVGLSDAEQELRDVFFLKGGTALHFSIAIDFTASNGDYRDPKSLHSRDPATGENQYTIAIKAIGEILQDYDSDMQFPSKSNFNSLEHY